MNILIVGSGGREHALAWKCAQSTLCQRIYVAPGNAGTQLEQNVENVAIPSDDIDALLAFAKEKPVDLTIIGPEAPLAAGIVDSFQSAGLACFGPSQDATQLESSKVFSKNFMRRHNIPTANSAHFYQTDAAHSYVDEQGAPIVIKADGLAAGKGVVVAMDLETAHAAIDDMLTNKQFGDASASIVIEEFLEGEEASFIVMVDGKNILPLATSQDHKARDNGDKGPNTGGMGAYSPAPVVTPARHQQIMEHIIKPTVAGMAKDGIPYTGFLYAGLMISACGNIKVLEFNCRFGDPETQPVMMRLQSDLVALCLAGTKGELQQQQVDWDPRTALGVVLAAEGYPGSYEKGTAIPSLPYAEQTGEKVFFAGVNQDKQLYVTNGGRVLCATALAEGIVEAHQKAYELVEKIAWESAYYRQDIGHRAMMRDL